ncbi:hypothetical protein [Streptomyces griseoviridis]|uniref:Uncharacterized protein n=1 Tax=Streptomyces griseoviridis TaxID=45398 RepID=A0ABT9LJD8_STRGD|nr:hypothetical protein [Streptomyces griseoviridis]GGS86431.1 hypothetical protein GCM10010240_19900 [Streptomyces griseoviridis]
MIPARPAPLLDQSDSARARPADAERVGEPVPDRWPVRRRTDGPGARAGFLAGAGAWGRDAAALVRVGHRGYPYGGDPEEPFPDVVGRAGREVPHHGAEIALLRDLYRADAGRGAR